MPDAPPARPLRTAVIGLSVLTVLAALVIVPDLLGQLRSQAMPSVTVDCDPQDRCEAVLPSGALITLTTGALTQGEPTRWALTAPREATLLSLDVSGISMNMGLTRVPLQGGAGAWSGEAPLPSCTQTEMDWRADAVLLLNGAPNQASFRFSTSGLPSEQAAPTQGARDDIPVTHGDFTIDTAAGPRSLSDSAGKVVFLYFGYTSCPDICPTTLAVAGKALSQLPSDQQSQVDILFVSVDPERDPVDRLATYGAFFHDNVVAGTAPPARIEGIAADWGVRYRKVAADQSAMAYTVDHSTQAFLVGRDGTLLREIAHGTTVSEVADAMRAALE